MDSNMITLQEFVATVNATFGNGFVYKQLDGGHSAELILETQKDDWYVSAVTFISEGWKITLSKTGCDPITSEYMSTIYDALKQVYHFIESDLYTQLVKLGAKNIQNKGSGYICYICENECEVEYVEDLYYCYVTKLGSGSGNTLLEALSYALWDSGRLERENEIIENVDMSKLDDVVIEMLLD